MTDEVWDFADDQPVFNEIHLAGADQREEEGFVLKEILRTGEWPVIPVGGGIIRKPLKIVKDGISDQETGVISLAEVLENFKSGAIPNVQIPLSDDRQDHKNITRMNTGFIRDLWIVDNQDGSSKLWAKMEFTEPDVKEKVLRGTYGDVSCGIPWRVRSQGKEYGAALEHVAITNRPFIDGLGPFLAASDKEEKDIQVAHFSDSAPESSEKETPPAPAPVEDQAPKMTPDEIIYTLQGSLADQFNGSANTNTYRVTGLTDFTSGTAGMATVTNTASNTTWVAPYVFTGTGNVQLSAHTNWAVKEGPEKSEEENGEKDKPLTRKGGSPRSSDKGLDEARQLRELRLSQPNTNGNESGGSAMPTTGIEALDGLELSDEARTAFQTVLDENANLKARTRVQEADARIEELKDLGLEERPGFLKFYRQVYLSDDGGTAAVLLSDDGREKTSITALEILDRSIEALKGSDGKVELSDQALASGNDEKPPATPEDELAPVEDRVAAAREALYGTK